MPHKTGGVFLIFYAVALVGLIGYLPHEQRTDVKDHTVLLWLFGVVCILLGVVGAFPPLGYFVNYGRFLTFCFFLLGFGLCFSTPLEGHAMFTEGQYERIQDFKDQKNLKRKFKEEGYWVGIPGKRE